LDLRVDRAGRKPAKRGPSAEQETCDCADGMQHKNPKSAKGFHFAGIDAQ
jgi:hypothetical protein